MINSSDKKRVPIFQLNFDDSFIQQYKIGVENIFASDSLSEGHYVNEFEVEFSKFIGAKHSVAVNSGTAALELALRALDVKGKQVIVPTNTFVATAIAVERAGAELILVDIEKDTFSMSPDALENAITEDTGAVILVHIGGIVSSNVANIIDICAGHGVALVEDAAQAHGSSRKHYTAGTIGTVGCFSLFPTKVMTTAEGGLATTQDARIAQKMRSIKNFGRDPSNSLLSISEGANFKVTEFQGLMGILELERVNGRISKRNILAKRYQDLLESKNYQTISVNDGRSSYYKQIVKIRQSQDILHETCKKNGISLTGEVYKYPVHQQPVYEKMFDHSSFPVANEYSKSHICPPVYPELSLEDVSYVCNVLNEIASE